MFFKEIGLLLKNKREEMGISHETVANKLKIPLKSIIAIENGSLTELPHEVYVRTFLKGYARLLEFSHEEIQTVFSNIEDFLTLKEQPKAINVTSVETQPDGSKSKSIRFIVQLLLVALLGAGAYFYYVHNGRSETFNLNSLLSVFKTDESNEVIVNKTPESENVQDKKDQDESVLDLSVTDKEQVKNDINPEEKVLDNIIASEINEVVNAVDLNKISFKKSELENIGNELNTKIKNVAVSEVVNLDLMQVDTPGVEMDSFEMDDFETFIANTPEAFVIDWNALSDIKPGQQQAVIYVIQDCWMHVTVDGQARHFTLRKGNQREILFEDTLQLKLGNASAVTLFHNRKLVKIGDSTQLRTINLKAQ